MKIKTFFIVSLLCLSGCEINYGSSTDGKWDVNFMYNYENNNDIFKTYRIEHNTKIDETQIEKPNREGYEFTKWYKDSYCKIEWNFKKDYITSNTNIYAGWIKTNNSSSNEYNLTWTNVDGVIYEMINNSSLPNKANKDETISFKVKIQDNYSGSPVVYANNNVLVETSGVYSLTIKEDTVIKVLGITKNSDIQQSKYTIKFTLPTWDPVATNPRLYYWGSSTVSDSMFQPGATSNMKHSEGMTYYIEFETSTRFDGMIIVFDQGNEVKQSFDIVNNLPSTAGTYNIHVPDWGPDGWKQNSYGIWCFVAELKKV